MPLTDFTTSDLKPESVAIEVCRPNIRAELDAIRPVFMLAEWETRDLHARAFDATYAWTWHNTLHDIAMGKSDA